MEADLRVVLVIFPGSNRIANANVLQPNLSKRNGKTDGKTYNVCLVQSEKALLGGIPEVASMCNRDLFIWEPRTSLRPVSVTDPIPSQSLRANLVFGGPGV
jgi:hypothetical protein